MAAFAEARTDAKAVAAVERAAHALSLRKAGATYDQIAQQAGYSTANAALKGVQRALKATLQEPADELRTLELMRLDGILLVLWPMVQRGNLGAVDRALKVIAQRAKILGLESTTVEHAGEMPPLTVMIERVVGKGAPS